MLPAEVDTVTAVMITQQLELFVLGLSSAGLGNSHSQPIPLRDDNCWILSDRHSQPLYTNSGLAGLHWILSYLYLGRQSTSQG